MPETLNARVQAVLDAVDHGRFDGLQAQVDAALASAEQARSVRAATQVHAAFSLILYRHGQLAGASRHAAAALALSQDGPCPTARAEGRVAWARIDWSVGNLDAALAGLEQALVDAERAGDDRVLLHARNLLGLVHAELGDLDASLRWHQSALDAARRSGVPDLVLVACTNLAGRWLALGDRCASEGDAAQARLHWQQAVELSLRTEAQALQDGLSHGLPHLLTTHGATLVRLGRPHEALALFDRAHAIADREGDPSSLLHAARPLADAHLSLGDAEAARRALLHGVQLAAERGHRARQADLHQAASQLEEAQGRFADALAHHKQFHALREACAVDRARDKSMALAVRLETQAALAAAEAARQQARQLADEYERLTARTDALAQAALTDPLTGLSNRRCVDEVLPLLEARARAQGRPLHVALIDVDHFKQVNDRRSHAVGDAVLHTLGGILRRHCREGDLAGRLGGEEFIVTFLGTEPAAALAACERLRQAVRQHDWGTLDAGLSLTVSIGLADVTATADLASGLAQADRRLYRAKDLGRDRVCASG